MIFSFTVLIGLALCFAVSGILAAWKLYRKRKQPMEVPRELISTLGIVRTEDGFGKRRVFNSAKYSVADFEFDEKHPHPCFELED